MIYVFFSLFIFDVLELVECWDVGEVVFELLLLMFMDVLRFLFYFFLVNGVIFFFFKIYCFVFVR